MVEAAAYLLDAHRAHPGRRELDGQGQAVEAGHDVGDRLGGQVGVGPRGAGPLHEQRRGVVGRELAQGDHLLGRQAQRGAAGRQHMQVAGRDQEQRHQRRDGLEHVLAVVEHQERGRGVELGGDLAAHVGELGGSESTARGHRTAHAQRRADLGDHVVARGDADQLDEVDARLARLAGEDVGDACLAQAAGPDDRDQAAAPDRSAQLGQVVVAPEQVVGLEVDAVAHRAVGDEQLAVQPLERRVGVDAEPVGEVGAVVLVALERGCRSRGDGHAAQQGCGHGDVVDRLGVRGLEVGEGLLVPAGARQRQSQDPPGPAAVGGGVAAELGERPVVTGRLLVTSLVTSLAPIRVAGSASSTALAASPVSSAAAASRVSRRSSNASTSSAGTPSR